MIVQCGVGYLGKLGMYVGMQMSEMLPNAIIVALHTNYTLGHLV